MPDVINVKDFRCVPLDILQNVDKDGNIGVDVNNESTELKKITDEAKGDILASGQISAQPYNAKTQTNLIIFFSVLLTILFIGILFFIGFGNIFKALQRNPKIGYTLLGMLIMAWGVGVFFATFYLARYIRSK